MNEARAIAARVQDDGERFRLARSEMAKYYRRLRELAGKQIVIEIEEDNATRSHKQNRYYWGLVVTPLAKSQEMVPEDFHDAMCERFLPNERKRVEFFNRLTGESLQVEIDPRRSSKLKGGPFFDFVERVREFGRDWLGVHTEDPDPEYWRKR